MLKATQKWYLFFINLYIQDKLNFISQNNNIGFVYLAKVMSNPSLFRICQEISLTKFSSL